MSSVLRLAALVVLALASFAATAGSATTTWKAWLCLPGAPSDPCYVTLTTTAIDARGRAHTEHLAPASKPPVDCFYVYPTVSEEHRGNSTLVPTQYEQHAAITEASEFSRLCRIWAPMYRQVTVFGNGNPFHGSYSLEYEDVLAAWHDYLARSNKGRGVVLIGHSEGSFLLEKLIRDEIEKSPSERKLIISAILLGGDVTVANGRTTGGSFRQTPACTSPAETDCVVAYSSWIHTPPGDAEFQSVPNRSQHVLCVNPAAPGSKAAAPITPVFPGISSQGILPVTSALAKNLWVALPDLYKARCVQRGSRAWLLVTRIEIPGDRRPTVTGVLAPNWGLHAADVNIALGSLISLVTTERAAWLAHHR